MKDSVTVDRFYLRCPKCGTTRRTDMGGEPNYFEDRCEYIENWVSCGTLLKYPDHLVKHQRVIQTCEIIDIETRS